MREVFEALVQGVAQGLQISAPELLVSGAMEVDGVDFRMLLHESPVEGVVILLCRFGPLSDEDPLAMCRLLQTNLQLVDGEMSSYFAMDEASMDVVFCVRTMLLDTSVEDLLECIRVCTLEAKAWRGVAHSPLARSGVLMP